MYGGVVGNGKVWIIGFAGSPELWTVLGVGQAPATEDLLTTHKVVLEGNDLELYVVHKHQAFEGWYPISNVGAAVRKQIKMEHLNKYFNVDWFVCLKHSPSRETSLDKGPEYFKTFMKYTKRCWAELKI